MATKKKQTQTEETKPVVATIGTIKTILDLAWADPLRGVPVLVGPSQWGKTHFLRDWMGANGLRLVMANPQCDLPEDIAGWPYRTKGTLGFTQPPIIPAELLYENTWGLFVDEIDKAREDTLSSLLSLFDPSERRLRRTILPEGVPLVGAMNVPRRPLPEPLVNRMLFLPWPPPGGVDEMFPRNVRFAATSALPPVAKLELSFPMRENAPGSYFKLSRWMSEKVFWEDEAVKQTVLHGLFPAATVPTILHTLRAAPPLSYVDWAREATPKDVALSIYHMLHKAPIEERNEAMQILVEKAQKDETKEHLRVLAHVFLHDKNRTEVIGITQDDAEIERITKELLAELG